MIDEKKVLFLIATTENNNKKGSPTSRTETAAKSKICPIYIQCLACSGYGLVSLLCKDRLQSRSCVLRRCVMRKWRL